MNSFYRMIIIQILWLILLVVQRGILEPWRFWGGIFLVLAGTSAFALSASLEERGQKESIYWKVFFYSFSIINLLLAVNFIFMTSSLPDIWQVRMRVRVLYLALVLLFFSILLSEDKRVQDRLEKLVAERTAEIKTERDRLALIVANLKDGVLLVGNDGFVTLSNGPFQAVCGLNPEAIKGIRPAEIPEPVLSLTISRLEYMKPVEIRIVRDDGEHDIELEKVPVDDGRAGYLVIVRDITSAKAIGGIKDEFTGRISEALMSPLNTVAANLEPIIDNLAGPIPEEARQYLANAAKGLEELKCFLRDLVDFSNMERGQYKYFMEKISLAGDIIDPCMEYVVAKAAGRGLEIKVNIPSGLPQIRGDREALSKAFNAVFEDCLYALSDCGRLSVNAEKTGNFISVTVEDNGKNPGKEMISGVFASGYGRGDNPASLAMAFRILAGHQGSLDVRFSESGGAMFEMRLPCA